MARAKLADNATIEEIIDYLDNPVEYVRGVFGNMHKCKKDHGTAFVKIGTTGSGIAPHYRVEPEWQLDDFSRDELFDAHFVAYNDRNHKALDWGFRELRSEHWSENKMSYDDVRNILALLRNFKQKNP
jgi:hypothetical protein